MFDNLSEKLQQVFRRLRGKGKLTPADVDAALREVRLALLEADVNYKVVRDFITRIREQAVGEEVMQSLTPAQQVIKIVHSELIRLLGERPVPLVLSPEPPTVVFMVGLQGSGKTTTVAKLAKLYKQRGHGPLLVAADIYRPAAQKQLQVLGNQIGVGVYAEDSRDAPGIATRAVAYAKKNGYDLVIVDTAGRLHVDEELMRELVLMKQAVRPHATLLVVDAMTGQDAVNAAEAFHERVEIDGVILTKLDSDARGGAALSVRAVTGRPIMFVGVGEKLDALEPFYPDRMASRILGMGDVLTLIDRAQAQVSAEKAAEMERKLRQAQFTLDDFLDQLQQVRSMGPIGDILAMIPGMNRAGLKNLQVDERDLAHVEAIVRSMTREERRNPSIIDASRRRRIARGSGTSIQDVNRLLKQYEETKKLLRQFARPAKGLRGRGFKFPF